jgi:hypothetical protein
MFFAVVSKALDIRLGLGFLAIAVVTAAGFYLVRKLRDHFLKEDSPTTNDLFQFEEIHSQGVISPEEFRTIKTALAARVKGEKPDFQQLRDEVQPNDSKPDADPADGER